MYRHFKSITLLFLLLISCFGWSQKLISTEQKFHFGYLKETDGIQSHDFELVNTGSDTIKIKEVISSCNCTSSSIDSLTIAPQDTSKITLSYNPADQSGSFERKIIIKYSKDSLALKLEGAVFSKAFFNAKHFPHKWGEFQMKTKTVQLGHISAETSISQSFWIYNKDSISHTLQFINSNSPFTSDTVIKTIAAFSFESIQIYADVNDDMKKGYNTDTLNFRQDDSIDTKLTLAYTVTSSYANGSKGKLHIDTLLYRYGSQKKGTKVTKTFLLKNTGAEALFIESIQPECACVSYDLSNKKIKANNEVELKITFDSADRQGTQRKKIHIHTNSKKTPIVTIKFEGVIN